MAKVSDFASELVGRYGLKEEEATEFISAMFDIICEQLDGADKQVKVKGLGTFKVTSVGARASVDVNTGERIIIEGRNKISFTPEVMLRDRVNRPFVQFETVVLNDGVDFSEIDNEFNGSKQEVAASDSTVETANETVANDAEEVAEKAVVETIDASVDESVVGAEEDKSDVAIEEKASDVVPENVMDQGQKEEAKPELEIESVPAYGHEPMSEVEADKDSDESQQSTVGLSSDESVEKSSDDSQQSSVESSETASQPKEVVVAEGCKQRNPRLMYWFSIASFVLLIFIGVGMYFLYEQVKAKNVAIEQLQTKLAMHSMALKSAAVEPKQDVASKKNIVADTTDAAKQVAITDAAETVAKEEMSQPIDKTHEPPVAEKKKANVPKPAADYNFDVRVRTGAYIIVGEETSVTVRSGQTLASISKAYLGPGMECYVEVFNNRKEVKPGDKLRIPKLKIKPRH
ncbi:HU family DNA-binding protein [uncultured Prevotella sp.]|mgnify:CR=1 FL=1|jgi:nucleoid DNA-binding protein/nucleoid-associated protein YgaU|uniref:HU family DNA-binding protein n=1 Tax=uncultured Prevotella sp. TaxID=159272 RepID=UPI0027E2C4CA|nr:HU family DNA-binding protein [uncultured Prevotella sp.]